MSALTPLQFLALAVGIPLAVEVIVIGVGVLLAKAMGIRL
jgi:hypothetical protein